MKTNQAGFPLFTDTDALILPNDITVVVYPDGNSTVERVIAIKLDDGGEPYIETGHSEYHHDYDCELFATASGATKHYGTVLKEILQ